MKRPRRAIAICCACTITWLGLCSVVGVIAAEIALHPDRRVLAGSDIEMAQGFAMQENASLQVASLKASDGVALHAWEFEPLRKNGDAVLLLHGVSDNRTGMLETADLLLHSGYAVLLPDARAHGESDGSIATYGILEKHDIHDWVAFLQSTQHPQCIDGLGDSMGAAQLLQSIAIVPDFCAVVAESSFADFREAAFDRIGQQFGTGPWLGRTFLRPAVEIGVLYARIRYGVDLTLAAPDESVAASSVPVLLIHGQVDTNLPPRHSEKILSMSRERQATNVVLWEPPNAEHCGAASAAPDEYRSRVLNWFASHRRSQSSIAQMLPRQ